jgi:HK97 family phage major capsid protein
MSTKLLAIVRDQIKSAEAEIETLNKEREVRQAEADRLVADAEKESRDLDNKEQARFREVAAQIREIDAKLDNDSDDADERGLTQTLEALKERKAELDASFEAREKAQKAAERWSAREVQTEVRGGSARIKSEPRTYSPDAARRGQSFFRDIYARQWNQDPGAAERLERHSREARFNELAGYEARDVTSSNFSGLVVPQYLTDMVAPMQRAMAPTVAIANRHELPANGNTIEISRITTGTAVGAQSGEGGANTETDIDDTLLTVNVRTYTGMQDVSRQALERGTMVESILTEDLGRAYWTKVDSDVLNGLGTNGTHTGIRSTSNIEAVTYATSTPAVGELYPKLAELISEIQAGVYMGVSHFIMHPRRWWWIASQVSESRPFLHVPGVSTEQAGNVGGTDYAADGNILGVPVVVDGNIPITLGGSTNEDVIIGVTARELHFWHDNGPLFIRAEQPQADTLEVRFVLYSYSAFTAGRYPGAHGTVSSTGLVTPTFA